MITDEHRAKAREIVTTALTRAASDRSGKKTADLLLDLGDNLDRAITRALVEAHVAGRAEQKEADARIAENDHCHLVAAAIRAGGGNERAP